MMMGHEKNLIDIPEDRHDENKRAWLGGKYKRKIFRGCVLGVPEKVSPFYLT